MFHVDQRARAIEELYRRRYRRFHATLSTITGGFESGHDAVQETFARALKQRAQFRGEGSLEAWVWRIGLRTAAELRRGRNSPSQNGVPAVELIDQGRDPEISAAVRDLPPRRRLLVFLRYFADLSYAEIAAVCGISEGTVAAALAQARDQLLHILEEGRAQ